ncbi:MAG: hypothetical protein IT330_06760 [Anaerolineae bacterium]|nr:hypothetical protein [Anaerolineae bacterium]
MSLNLEAPTELLDAILQAERKIAANRQELHAARAERAAALQLESDSSKTLANLDSEIKRLGGQPHRRSRAAYLDGETLERGTLTLTSDAVHFSGWRGKVEIPLRAIQSIALGTSLLPPFAGIPILGNLWPGRPRSGETILLTVRESPVAAQQLAVIGDLKEAALWQQEILIQQQQVDQVTALKTQLLSEREEAVAALAKAREAFRQAQSRVELIEKEAAVLRAQMDTLKAQQRAEEAKARSAEVLPAPKRDEP